MKLAKFANICGLPRKFLENHIYYKSNNHENWMSLGVMDLKLCLLKFILVSKLTLGSFNLACSDPKEEYWYHNFWYITKGNS